MDLEVVIENLDEAKLANKYGVKRIEVCSGLDLGGLTPSVGFVVECLDQCSLEVHVMIRPYGGNFYYNKEAINIMYKDIKVFSDIGVKGVVFGILNTNNTINEDYTKYLVEYAKSFSLQVTFHRAIDFTPDLNKSMEVLQKIGIDRILTSGQGADVSEGFLTLKRMTSFIKRRKPEIMAGGGVDVTNIKNLLSINLAAIHFNVRKIKKSGAMSMGNEYELDEAKIKYISSLLNQ